MLKYVTKYNRVIGTLKRIVGKGSSLSNRLSHYLQRENISYERKETGAIRNEHDEKTTIEGDCYERMTKYGGSGIS